MSAMNGFLSGKPVSFNFAMLADESYQVADKMLEYRNK